MGKMTKAEQVRAIEFLTKRIGDALSIYAAAIVVEEEDPDFGLSMLPVSTDEDNGEVEVHFKDTIDTELPDGIFRISVEFGE